MKKYTFLATAAITALMSSPAMAIGINTDINAGINTGINTKNLPEEGAVTINGVVDSVENENKFVLRDSSGKVDVDLKSKQSTILKKGDQVSVTGVVDNGILGTDIRASEVEVQKTLTQGISDVVKGVPGVSTANAAAFNIGDLPDAGNVKVSGIVTDIDNEKEFTLEDDSGAISVDITSAERAVLTEGAEVTVIGVMDKGLVGKNIEAQKVIVVSDANAEKR